MCPWAQLAGLHVLHPSVGAAVTSESDYILTQILSGMLYMILEPIAFSDNTSDEFNTP